MEVKYIPIIVLVLSMGAESKKIPISQQYPYVMHLDLKFNEENVTSFVAESFFATNGWTVSDKTYCEITLFDILNAIPFKKTPQQDLTAAFSKLQILVEDEDISDFIESLDYMELSNMGFSVGRLYKNFVKTYFKNGTAQLVNVLEALDIDTNFIVAYDFGTDEEMFNSLKEAKFSSEAITEVENIINVTFTLNDFSKIFGIKKLDSLYVQEFVNNNLTKFLATKEIQMVNFEEFLKSFALTLDEYKDIKSFKTCYNTWTQNHTLAVAVSPNEIMTNDNSLLQTYLSLDEYSTLTISTAQNHDISYVISSYNASNNGTFITFTVNSPITSYIEKTSSYELINTKTCIYITDTGKALMAQNFTAQIVNDRLAISKLSGAQFKKGSPIICDEKLYGLAVVEDLRTITFDTFENTQKNIITEIIQDKEKFQHIIELFNAFLLSIKPCDIINCGTQVTEEEQPVGVSSCDEGNCLPGLSDSSNLPENNPCDNVNCSLEAMEDNSSNLTVVPCTNANCTSKAITDNSSFPQEYNVVVTENAGTFNENGGDGYENTNNFNQTLINSTEEFVNLEQANPEHVNSHSTNLTDSMSDSKNQDNSIMPQLNSQVEIQVSNSLNQVEVTSDLNSQQPNLEFGHSTTSNLAHLTSDLGSLDNSSPFELSSQVDISISNITENVSLPEISNEFDNVQQSNTENEMSDVEFEISDTLNQDESGGSLLVESPLNGFVSDNSRPILMMSRENILLVITCACLTTCMSTIAGQEFSSVNLNISTNEVADHVVLPIFQIKYSISEKKYPEIISDLITNNSYHYNIDTENLLEILNLNETNLHFMTEHVDFEQVFNFTGVNVVNVIQEIVNNVQNKGEVLPKILDILNIDNHSYMSAIAYDNQMLMYKLLKTANYSEEALTAAYKFANSTDTDITRIITGIVSEQLQKKSIKEIMDKFQSQVFYWIIDVLSNKSLSDVLENSLIFDISVNFTNTINADSSLVVAIDQNRFITIRSAFLKWDQYKNYVDGVLVNIEDDKITYGIKDIFSNRTYSIVEVDGNTDSFFEKTNNYSSPPTSCLYFVKSVNGIMVSNVTDPYIEEFRVCVQLQNVSDVSVQAGTPLICDGQLYGLLLNQEKETLYFDTLMDDLPEHDNTEYGGGVTFYNNNLYVVAAIAMLLI